VPILESPLRQIRNLPEAYIPEATKYESEKMHNVLCAIQDKIVLYKNGQYIGDQEQLINSILKLATIATETDFYARIFRREYIDSKS